MKDTIEKKSKFARILDYSLSLINDVLRERRQGTAQTTKKAESKSRMKNSNLGEVN